MNGLISEFFFEGIRRIIPGLVLIALCFHKEVVTIFEMHHDLFLVMLNAGVLVMAWVIGFTVEQLTAIVVAIAFKICKGECVLRKIRGLLGIMQQPETKSESMRPQPAPEEIKHKREMRRHHYLYFAGKTMCRSLFAIFLIPYIPYIPNFPESFSVFPNINPHSFCWMLALVFFVCWLWAVINDERLTLTKLQASA